jgi:hypothetical protein
MLRSSTNTWVPLQQEVRCLQSYFYLLQVRYGTMVAIDMKIAEQQYYLQLPSLCLPLVVEEAIRTSQLSKTDPLLIRFASNKDNIMVSYQRRPKLRLIDTGGLDWMFLADRFEEQSLKGFTHSEKEGLVTIVLPLLQHQQTFAAA